MSSIDEAPANAEAFRCLTGSESVITDIHPAIEVLPGRAEFIERHGRLCEIDAAVQARATFRSGDLAIAGCIATIERDGCTMLPEVRSSWFADEMRTKRSLATSCDLTSISQPPIEKSCSVPDGPHHALRAVIGLSLFRNISLRTVSSPNSPSCSDFESAPDRASGTVAPV